MEADRFDRLVKSLASVDTRRGLLRVLLSVPLAAGAEQYPLEGREIGTQRVP